MTILITILILIACLVLAFFVLVQAPKGGGLTGNFGTLSTQVMGVKQSGDVMEKGTWTTMGVIAALCIISLMFVTRPSRSDVQQEAPSSSTPATGTAPAGGAQPAGGGTAPAR